MSYSVQHVRYTLECDACGLVEKRDLDQDSKKGTEGWGEVRTPRCSGFCCPGCNESVMAILTKRARADLARTEQEQSTCKHDYQPLGLLAQCTKCKRWR